VSWNYLSRVIIYFTTSLALVIIQINSICKNNFNGGKVMNGWNTRGFYTKELSGDLQLKETEDSLKAKELFLTRMAEIVVSSRHKHEKDVSN
jgi:hypothetical protein